MFEKMKDFLEAAADIGKFCNFLRKTFISHKIDSHDLKFDFLAATMNKKVFDQC